MTDREDILRSYAKGLIAWSTLREQGFESYRDVLAGLGEFGLRPPVAATGGPNEETRASGRDVLRQALLKAS